MIQPADQDLLPLFIEYIEVPKVQQAFNLLVGVGVTSKHFQCEARSKGVVRDFRYYCSGEQPFALIVNKQSLLFYLRKPAVRSSLFEFDRLASLFPSLKKNNSGEWTLSVADIDSAEQVAEEIISKWKAG